MTLKNRAGGNRATFLPVLKDAMTTFSLLLSTATVSTAALEVRMLSQQMRMLPLTALLHGPAAASA